MPVEVDTSHHGRKTENDGRNNPQKRKGAMHRTQSQSLEHEDGSSNTVYRMDGRTVCRTLIPNLGLEAFLVGLKIQDPASKLKACRKLL